LAAYDVTLAVPLSGHLATQSGVLPETRSSRHAWACLGIILLCGGFELHYAKTMETFTEAFNDRYIPVLATRFLEREKSALASHNFYNDQHGWGGYLAYELHPDYRIFQDGRYIFHPLLKEAADAIKDPAVWEKFLDHHQIEVAVMENVPRLMETNRLYPDGSIRVFLRPYYIVYMTKTLWALVYWDDKALIFVRRGSVSAEWLGQHEYRYALPHDGEARGNALRRKEIQLTAVQEEFLRHTAEVASLQ